MKNNMFNSQIAHITISDKEQYEALVNDGYVREVNNDKTESPVVSTLLIVPSLFFFTLLIGGIIFTFFYTAHKKVVSNQKQV